MDKKWARSDDGIMRRTVPKADRARTPPKGGVKSGGPHAVTQGHMTEMSHSNWRLRWPLPRKRVAASKSRTCPSTGCFRVYRTVDWVAYRSAWVRGGCAGPLSPPLSSPGPGRAVGNPIDCRVIAVTPGTGTTSRSVSGNRFVLNTSGSGHPKK